MSTPRSSNVRRVVLWFAIGLAIITYVDRVCISQAKSNIQNELGLTDLQIGYVFSTFIWAYALFEIPGGWLGDRIGPRKVLMRVVSMWSIFTIATGWASSFWSLIVCRFFFGVGEAGCFPNITKAFSNWFPLAERVRAQGILWLSARWGGALTPFLVSWMLATGGDGKAGLGLHYKWVFLIFGLLGIVWAVLFYAWFRDDPKDNPSVSSLELAHIGDNVDAEHHSFPLAKLLASRTVWMLWSQYFFMSYSWYFYITWFPTYIKTNFGQYSDLERGLLSGVPLFFGGFGCLTAGVFSSFLDRRFRSVALTRRVLGFLGMGMAGIMIIVSMQFSASIYSIFAIGMAAYLSDLAMPGSWGACMDVGGRDTGAISGSMNMMGQFGGALGPIVVPLVLLWTDNNWNVNMACFSAAYLIGATCWLFINSDERLHADAD